MTEFIPGVTPVPASGKVIGEEETLNGIRAVMDGWLTEGRWTKQFEQDIAKYLGRRHALFCNSGSSANLLAISALMSPMMGERRLKPGDEVITCAAGFPTTVFPIFWNRLKPVFIDVDMRTYVPNHNQVNDAMTEKTRAIIIAHTLGNPWDVTGVKAHLQDREQHVFIIEDNCDALGSIAPGLGIVLTGKLGDMATQSFYPAHHITTGEGGMLLTDDSKLFRAAESIRDWGRDCWCAPGAEDTCNKRFSHKWKNLPEGYDHKYVYSHLGFNLKATDMQAAIGVAQARRIEEFNRIRRENWHYLYHAFCDLNYPKDFFILPAEAEGSDPAWFGFALTLKDDCPFNLVELERFLADKKIGTRRLFAGNLLAHPVFEHFDLSYETRDIPNTTKIMKNTFWIGCWHGLTTAMLDYVLETFRDFLGRY